jgi:hypothetical protein
MKSLIHDPSAWPPGSLMVYNNHDFYKQDTDVARHFAVGLVISNSGTHLRVLWPDHCGRQVKEYEISTLNDFVIRKVRL